MSGERPDTKADITKMKALGWKSYYSAKEFLAKQGYENKLMKAGKIWGKTELIHANGVLEFS